MNYVTPTLKTRPTFEIKKMVSTLITLLVAIVIFCLIIWVISLIPTPASAPFLKNIIYAIVGIIFIIWLCQNFGLINLR